MHIYFVGIGGTGIGPLALIASQTGYQVSGSDMSESEYTHYLNGKGITVFLEQSGKSMAELHSKSPIDWVVGVSSILRNTPNHPELVFAREHGIRISERDECLNQILDAKNLKMIAAAGTHGKTTTTAMLVWAFKKLGIPVSYSVGAKTSFADMGRYEPGSKYFVYECDEFHRNFLKFYPEFSLITGIAWDHHEVYPTKEDYNQAFVDFIGQSKRTILWRSDYEYLNSKLNSGEILEETLEQEISVSLAGRYNRRDAILVIEAMHRLTNTNKDELTQIMNQFPGTSRRMEEIAPNLFSDYAHTPEKIKACMSVALETAQARGKKVAVIYEPLTNRRQYYVREGYKDCFKGTEKILWVPSYLAREDPNQPILTPNDLIANLSNPAIATPAALDEELYHTITQLLPDHIVVCMSGGGGNSLDEWLRKNFINPEKNQSADLH